MQDIVSENQSAFVPGRLITDNAVIAFECLHVLQHKEGDEGLCAYKLYLAKAYDTVDWLFLRTQEMMGFNNTWIQWLIACVSTGKIQWGTLTTFQSYSWFEAR